MLSKATITVAIAVLLAPLSAEAQKSFLAPDASKHYSLTKKAFQADITNAMGSMLGCGGEATPQKIASIQKVLEPMWRTLPKTTGHIDRRSLRYLVHRYFMQTSSLMIRGFEPTRTVNESNWGVADVLSQMVPAYVESVLESHHAKSNGFSLKDVVSMVVMLEQLILDSESTLLAKIYADQHKPADRALSHNDLKEVLESYMVQWMVEADDEDLQVLMGNRSLMVEVVPHFEMLVKFAEGRIEALQFERQQHVPKGRAHDTWEAKYSFEDAHHIVGGITQTFQSYWQSECESMKSALVAMDTDSTGVVPLSKFYNTAINTDWRFGESEAYLRELGALDESLSLGGKSVGVIIPNYIQATSNCIVSSPHYLVCCRNECEDILGDIEVAIGSSTAAPSDILAIVGNMTIPTSLEEEDSPQLIGSHTVQLEQIAKMHGDRVPLHGRLFAVWLHNVFPRECPLPHKLGVVSSVTPSQYGDDYIAKESDMKKHVANADPSSISIKADADELQWMSQWAPEDELVDYTPEFSMSWGNRLFVAFGGLALLTFGIARGVVGGGNNKARMPNQRFSV